MNDNSKQKTVALVLGSGGARGYAHIGVLDALKERNYEVVAISGSSMGALIGGFYCAGKLEDYRRWVTELSHMDVLRLIDVSFGSGGFIRGEKVFNTIGEMLDGVQIEDLDIPFTAVATDVSHHKEVWFQKGPLDTAIRASAAIPSVFQPIRHNGATLVDGGVLNPLPITPTVQAQADITIAVDLNADTPLPDWFDPQEEDDQRSEDKLGWLTPVLQKAGSLMEMINRNQDTEGDDVGQEVEEKLSKLELISRSLELMQRSLTRFKIAGYPPDLLIKMPMDACEMYEFYRASEMIELGYRITNNVLDGYEKGQNSTYGHRIS